MFCFVNFLLFVVKYVVIKFNDVIFNDMDYELYLFKKIVLRSILIY